MILEFSTLGLVVFFSWLLSAPLMGLLSVFIAGAVLFSQSIPIDILLLISLTIFSYVIAVSRSKKQFSALTQLYYGSRLLLLFVALLGSALRGYSVAPLLTFLGLLGALPLYFSSLFFSRHFESMTLRAFIYSVLLPALTILNVLVKIKTDVKVEWGQCWDVLLTLLGVSSLLCGTFIALFKRKTHSLLVHLSVAWVGLGLFLLVMDAEALTPLAMGALSAFAITTPILMSLGKQLGPDYERTSRIILLGAPGFLGFSMMYYTVRLISTMNVHWLWPVVIAFIFQAFALLANDYVGVSSGNQKTKIRFFLLIAIQFLCSACFYWVDKMGGR